MIIETSFMQAHIPVFCDECKVIARYITQSERKELEREGWEGDWLCDACWDKLPQDRAFGINDLLGPYFLGFVEVQEESVVTFGHDKVSLVVRVEKRVEVTCAEAAL